MTEPRPWRHGRRLGWPALLLLCAASIAEPGLAHAQSAQDLFKSVFGKKATRPAPRRFDVPVTFLIYELGLATIETQGSEDPVLIDRTDLRTALERIVVDPALTVFDGIEPAATFLMPAQIADADITVTYDPATLALAVDVPWDLQQVLDISLLPRAPEPPAPLGPAPVTAILNMRGGVDVVWDETLTDQDPPGLSLALDSALQIRGLVLEADADIASDLAPRGQLLRLRLFHDDIERRVRAEIGDVDIVTTGFQSAPRLAGIGISRNFDLQPDRPFRPRGSRLLTVERNSVAEVLTNGRVIDTFPLSPGRYRLTDLPLDVGANDFTIRLTDDAGVIDAFPVSLFFDPGLLGAGQQDFGYAAGVETRPDGAYQSADTDRWVASAFHRLGLSDTVTVGAGVQGARRRTNLGVQIGWASRFGNIDLLAEGSRAARYEGGTAALQWEKPDLVDPERGWQLDLGWSAGYTSRFYAPFSTDPDRPEPNDAFIDLAARVSAGFGVGWRASVAGERVYERDGVAGSGVVGTLRRELWPGASMDVLSTVDRSEGRTEHAVSLGLSIQLGGSHNIDVVGTLPEESAQVTWSRRPKRAVQDWTGAVTLAHTETEDRADATLRYIGQRGEIDLQASEILSRTGTGEPGRTIRRRGALGLSTSLVYADGSAGIGRPVTNSFALIRRHPNLADQEIRINPAEDTFLARSDGFGALVIPGLSDYVLQQIRLDAPDLAVGQDLGDERPFLRPGARSGVIVTAGTDASVILTARLVDAEGTPHALKAGDLTRLGSTGDADPLSFFSNRQGRIAIEGLKPGRYRLRLLTAGRPETEIRIDREAQGLFRAGIIEVTP